MICTLLATACLVGTVSFFIDLKIDKWEWSNEQRKIFLTLCAIGAAVFSLWAGWHPILIRSVTAFIAAVALGLTVRDWHQRSVKWHAIASKKQRRIRKRICVASLAVFILMVLQILYFKGIRLF